MNYSGAVHTSSEEFQNGDFKTHQMFSVHAMPEKFLKRNNQRSFWIGVLRESHDNHMTEKSYDNRDAIVFEKLLFQNTLRPRKAAVCKFLRLEVRF